MTSSHSENTSAPAAATPLSRQNKLNIIRSVIAEERFSPEEIGVPSSFDIIAVCSALRSFPIQMTITKITIIIALASVPMTQSQLQDFTSAEQSNLSHILTSLRESGYITKESSAVKAKIHLTPSGKNVFTMFLRQYYHAIDAMSQIVKNTKLDN